MSGAPRPRGWTCRKCKRWESNSRVRICKGCGKNRPLRKSKHAVLLDAARPQYQVMLDEQQGRCAICLRAPSSDRRLDIDHDHHAMTIRGLLCHRCNRRLDSTVTAEWLRAAADYLDKQTPTVAPRRGLGARTARSTSKETGAL